MRIKNRMWRETRGGEERRGVGEGSASWKCAGRKENVGSGHCWEMQITLMREEK